jgi:drug/metabolite transporter (DMT)-like permease
VAEVKAPPSLSRADYAARLLACSLLWASGFLFMKLAGTVHPLVIAASRAVVASGLLALWFLAQGRSPLPTREELVPWAVLGTVNGWVPNILTAYALVHIASSLSAMIQAATPLVVAVMAHLAFADERLTLRRLGGVLLGFSGMAVLIGPTALAGAQSGAIGIACMACVSLCYAGGTLYARKFRDMESTRLALGQQTVSALAAVAIVVVGFGRTATAEIAAAPLPLIALGAIGTALPITIFMSLIRTVGPTRTSMIGYLMPVWATLLAVIFLGEHVGPREIAGAAIILTGVWVVSTAPAGRRLASA